MLPATTQLPAPTTPIATPASRTTEMTSFMTGGRLEAALPATAATLMTNTAGTVVVKQERSEKKEEGRGERD